MANYTPREIEGATLDRNTQAIVAHPSNIKLKQMVSSKSLINCRVTVNDVINTRAIFGPNLLGLRGRMTRQKPVRVETTYIGIPRQLYERLKM